MERRDYELSSLDRLLRHSTNWYAWMKSELQFTTRILGLNLQITARHNYNCGPTFYKPKLQNVSKGEEVRSEDAHAQWRHPLFIVYTRDKQWTCSEILYFLFFFNFCLTYHFVLTTWLPWNRPYMSPYPCCRLTAWSLHGRRIGAAAAIAAMDDIAPGRGTESSGRYRRWGESWPWLTWTDLTPMTKSLQSSMASFLLTKGGRRPGSSWLICPQWCFAYEKPSQVFQPCQSALGQPSVG